MKFISTLALCLTATYAEPTPPLRAPADPDIKVLPYNHATCSFTVVPGIGKDFFVS